MRLIAAMDERRGIATDEGIPWTLPSDQRFFVETTGSGLVLMGFRTYLEFDRPMHGRTNYIATRRTGQLRPGFVAVPDVAAFVAEHAGERINNIGGAVLFATTLPLADELVLTRIRADFACTKFFPEFEEHFDLATRSEPVREADTEFVLETWRPARRPATG